MSIVLYRYMVYFAEVVDRHVPPMEVPDVDYHCVTVEAEDRDEAIRKAYRILNNLDLDGIEVRCEILTPPAAN